MYNRLRCPLRHQRNHQLLQGRLHFPPSQQRLNETPRSGSNAPHKLLNNCLKLPVVKCPNIGYNILNLRCTTTPVSFEPTFTLNGIPILPSGCQALTHLRIGREGKSFGCGFTHLARARSQKAGTGILGE